MPGKLGLPEILLILFIALLIFGPSKLADLGKGIGEGIKNFKSAVKDGEQGTEKKSLHQRHWQAHHVKIIAFNARNPT
jgi:sec-independent protein translocase protein TatA